VREAMNTFTNIVQKIYATGQISPSQQQQLEQLIWMLPKDDAKVAKVLQDLEEDIVSGRVSISAK
jgi:hypothetical protein